MATWNSSFQNQPIQYDTPTAGDDEIRTLRFAIEERMKNEHTTYSGDSTTGLNTKDWLHKAGSGVAFVLPTASPPTVRGISEALIDGQLWYDTTAKVLKVRSSAAWAVPTGLPIGCVMFFSGTFTDNSTIPGWYICDGTDGTPNLVGKFIRGGSTSGATGGADTSSALIAHTHGAGTYATSAHTHTFSGTTGSDFGWYASAAQNVVNVADAAGYLSTTTTHSHTFSGTTSGPSSTAISGSSASAGSGASFSILPTYYTLVPIMRVS